MNNPLNQTAKPATHHPLMIAAAIAVILFCLAGTAAIMGWLPSSIGNNQSSGELTASDRAALASTLTDSNGNGFDNGPAGVEAQRAAMLAPAPAPVVVQRQPEPVRLAQAEPVRERAAVCSNCGRVESVRSIKTRAQGSGLGAAGGAVLGGLLGNQVGGGNGRKLATVAGAVGGAVVGNQVEGNMKATTSYEVLVRMDKGGTRSFTLQNLNGYNSGDRVKVVNGALRHAG